MATFQRIVPCLWFEQGAEEAANTYISIFPNSRVVKTTYYTKAAAAMSGKPEGSVLTVQFALDGQEFTALNGGPEFKFTEAVSLQILCESQEEVDYYWNKLCEGGEEGPCGWLKDKYGLSWQVVPTVLANLLNDSDSGRVERVMTAMFRMKKLVVSELERAFATE